MNYYYAELNTDLKPQSQFLQTHCMRKLNVLQELLQL